jgi:hypothetical protein
MAFRVNIKRLGLYGWIALGSLALGTLANVGQHYEQIGARVVNDTWRLVYLLFVHYILFEYTIPRLSWKDFGRSASLVVGHLILYSGGLALWRELGVLIGLYTPIPAGTHDVSTQMGYSVGSVLFFGVILYIYNHNRLKKRAQQLLIEKQQAELNYLKSQTNPHFLFNTLNNIYSLSRSKSDLAPEAILRLSKILRYMLYEAGGEYIAIEDELRIIGDYISLEKLRYDESLRVNFNYDVEDVKQSLPPLLLMPLVENAFKHGASETRHQPFVNIHLSVAKRRLSFVVRNSADGLESGEQPRENIGLSNLRRQLELLYGEYQLVVEPRGGEFCATLTINLASHV